MTWWQRVRRRWQLESDLDAELRYHVGRLVADLRAAGVPEAEARRRARAEFGGVEEIKDACRDVRGTRLVHDLAFDVRHAARQFAREPGFSMVAVLALALGIGVNNTLFTIVNALCLRAFPIDDASRVVEVFQRTAAGARQALSPAQAARIESAANTGLAATAAYATRPAALREADTAADPVAAAYVSPGLFALVGRSPAAGRGFGPDDDRPGAAPVVLLSDRLWRTRYGGAAGAIGREVALDGVPATVIGIMPPGFRFPDNADLWRPLAALEAPPGVRALSVIARLVPGRPVSAADAAMQAVLDDPAAAEPTRATAVPIDDRYRNPITNPAWLAFITTGILLVLLAASNVANLLLARGARRQREVAIRLALGATRTRIVRQVLVETAFLTAIGGVAGLVVSLVGLRVFLAAIPEGGLPYWVSVTMDGRVLGTLAAVCFAVVFLAGLLPAWRLARSTAPVQDSGIAAGSSVAAASRWSAVLLTGQLAITVILLSAMGLTTLDVLRRHDGPAIDGRRVLTFGVAPTGPRGADAAYRQRLLEELRDRLRRTGVVAAAALAVNLPPSAGQPRRLAVGGAAGSDAPVVRTIAVGADYFRALGVPLLSGRELAPEPSAAHDVVVSQKYVDLFIPGGSAIGRTVRLASGDGVGQPTVGTVVGVAPDLHGEASPPVVYVPLETRDLASALVLVRGSGNASSLTPIVRETMRALDPDVPLTRMMTLDEATRTARWNGRVSQGIITTIATIALALATVGLTALTVYGVARRRRELAIRLALGAPAAHLVWLVLRGVLVQVGVGLLLGALGARAWERLFGSPAGTLTSAANLAAVALLVTCVTLAAAAWPARRAARIDPLSALRSE